LIVRTALDVEDHNEPARQVIAAKIIELAAQQSATPIALREKVLATINFKTLPPRTFQQQA
jgi:hypothetical protein